MLKFTVTLISEKKELAQLLSEALQPPPSSIRINFTSAHSVKAVFLLFSQDGSVQGPEPHAASKVLQISTLGAAQGIHKETHTILEELCSNFSLIQGISSP
jgi:hypothetical protein